MKTILLFGGKSDERLVSVASAQNLIRHFEFESLWFFKPEGEIFSVSKSELEGHADPFKNQFKPQSKSFARSIEETLPQLQGKAVFLGFHGTEGEDGTFQHFFEKSKIPFTGSGSEASRLCFEKNLAKKMAAQQNIQTAAELVWDRNQNAELENLLGPFLDKHLKIVLKPVANGSSIGLFIVSNPDELNQAITQIRKSDYRYMAEKFVKGRELTVGVIEQDGTEQALSPSEVILNAGHSFDYDGKYLGRGTTEITPAILTDLEIQMAQALALKAHQIFGCRGYSRTDMILSENGVTFIETNTLPGLTKASFIPQQLQHAGLSMKAFIQQQMAIAEKR